MENRFKVFTENTCDIFNHDIELCEETNSRNMYISGIGLQANIKNQNGRIYPQQVLYEAVDNHVNKFFNLGRCCGELKHPKKDSHELNEDRISHRFTEVKKDGDNVFLKALVLNTEKGKQLKNLIEGGIKMGFSSRALGQVKQSNGVNIVQPGLNIVSLADAVYNNSAPDALIDAIYENKEFIYENGKIVEVDLSEDIDNYKKLIEKTTKKDRAEVFEKIITDYFKKIKF